MAVILQGRRGVGGAAGVSAPTLSEGAQVGLCPPLLGRPSVLISLFSHSS